MFFADKNSETVRFESSLYISNDMKIKILKSFTSEVSYSIWSFQKDLRKAELYRNSDSIFGKLLYCFFRRRYNVKGRKLDIEVYDGCFDKGLKIFHGSIVVHPNAVIGKNCVFHGQNCIGNDGKSDAVPVIGDDVNIGVGAKIIGGVRIANNITIGANSVVTKSFEEDGITIAGIPARKLCSKGK